MYTSEITMRRDAGAGNGTLGHADVVLVSMPWASLCVPSIQLHTLGSLLNNSGISVASAHFYVDFFNKVAAEIGGEYSSFERLEQLGQLFGEWMFAVPPFRAITRRGDSEYVQAISRIAAKHRVDAAFQMRSLVPDFLEHCLRELLERNPRVIGLTTTCLQNVPSLTLSKLIKQRRPDLKIVFGGGNCIGSMGKALIKYFPWIDVVVRGECESTAPRLFEELIAGKAVTKQPGLCFRRENKIIVCRDQHDTPHSLERDSTPGLCRSHGENSIGESNRRQGNKHHSLSAYEDFFERLRRGPFPESHTWLPYESARGCWWAQKRSCLFCSVNSHGSLYRAKSPERVLQDVEELSRNYGPDKLIFFVDSVMNPRYHRELFPRMRKAPVPMFVEIRANVTKPQLKAMREAGVCMVQLGFESMSTAILRLINKGSTAIQNIRVLKWCSELGIRAYYNIMYGIPGEPPEEYRRSADVVRSLFHLEPPNPLVRLRLYRFSPYFDYPDQYGIEITGPAYPARRYIYGLSPDSFKEIEYSFSFRYRDGREPEKYVAPLAQACAEWRVRWHENQGGLSYRRTTDGISIADCRTNTEKKIYDLGELEAKIYLSCDGGSSSRRAWENLSPEGRREYPQAKVSAFLESLTRRRLMFCDDACYLALATEEG